jgi:predicted methyltransferase
MKITRKDVLVAIITNAVLLLLGVQATEAEQALPPLSPAQIIAILSSPDRTAADRTNDLRRKPEQMLAFIGIRPGIVALDLSAASGYTTELLARSMGPTGKVYGQSRPRDPSQAPTSSSVPEGNSRPNLAPVATRVAPPAAPRPSPVALADRDARLHEAAFLLRRSSPSLGRSRIPFLRSWRRGRSIW